MARGFEEDGVQQFRPVKPLRERSDDFRPVRESRVEAKPTATKEIHVKINPARLARAGLLAIAVLAIFFLGRLSANNFQLTGLTTSETLAVEENKLQLEVAPEAGDQEVPLKQSDEQPSDVKNPDQDLDEDVVTETIVNTYKNTQINLNDVEIEWKETWGKIVALDYSIANNEPGSIEPGYFLVMVEGYDDVEKKATLEPQLQLVRSGETQSGKVTLDKPFNYNGKEVGNLERVTVRAILFNNADPPKPIASSQKELNLKG